MGVDACPFCLSGKLYIIQTAASVAKKPIKTDITDGPTFEESLQQLDAIVHALEEGQIGLDESLQRYEEGVKLLRRCYDLLQGAERRIELLTGLDMDGNPVTEPFDDQATLAAEQKSQRRTASRSPGEGAATDDDPATEGANG